MHYKERYTKTTAMSTVLQPNSVEGKQVIQT